MSRSFIIPGEDFSFLYNDLFENQYDQARQGGNVTICLLLVPIGVVLDDVSGEAVICGIRQTRDF